MLNKGFILLSVFFLFLSCDDPTPQEFKSFQLDVKNILCEENVYDYDIPGTDSISIQTNIIGRDFTSVLSNSSTVSDYLFENEMADQYDAFWTYISSSGYQVDLFLSVTINNDSEGDFTANFDLNEYRWHEDLGMSSFSVSGYALPESDAENTQGVIFQKTGIENCVILTKVDYSESDKNGILLKSSEGYSCDATSKATLQMFY